MCKGGGQAIKKVVVDNENRYEVWWVELGERQGTCVTRMNVEFLKPSTTKEMEHKRKHSFTERKDSKRPPLENVSEGL